MLCWCDVAPCAWRPQNFLNEHRMLGNIKNVAKTTKKEQLVGAIMSCLSAECLKPQRVKEVKAFKTVETKEVKAEVVDEGPPTFAISMLKKG
ncbi:peptidyl-prolyl cis-trans isomerase FKBP3-like [Stigmatopora nigra]